MIARNCIITTAPQAWVLVRVMRTTIGPTRARSGRRMERKLKDGKPNLRTGEVKSMVERKAEGRQRTPKICSANNGPIQIWLIPRRWSFHPPLLLPPPTTRERAKAGLKATATGTDFASLRVEGTRGGQTPLQWTQPCLGPDSARDTSLTRTWIGTVFHIPSFCLLLVSPAL